MALAMASKHYVWLRRALLQLLPNLQDIPHGMFSDSDSAIDIANNDKINDRTKHIDIAYHFTREKVEDGTINLMHIAGTENLSDLCTKALPRPTHDYFCSFLFDSTAK